MRRWVFHGMGILALAATVACGGEAPEVTKGRALAVQFKCLTCHTITGDDNATGPTFKGLAGRTVTLIDGSTVVADDAYLRESILDPNAKIVAGYLPSTMLAVTRDYAADLAQPGNVDALIAYIKSLK
jgi:cytochrome c oxidase subunit 2